MLCSSAFCCLFMCANPRQTLLMSACSSFHEHFFCDTFDVLCFHMTNSQASLNTSLCCAFYWRKSCHDHTLGLLCFQCTNPNQISILGSGGNLQLPRAKKEKNELSFKILSHLLAWSGPIGLRFEQGLLELCTFEKPACQSFAT